MGHDLKTAPPGRRAARGNRRRTSGGEPIRPHVLLVESSRFIANLVSESIDAALGYHVTIAESLQEAEAVIEDHPRPFLAAVVALELSDAPDGEVVELTSRKGVPTLVLTASYDEQTRNAVFAKGDVADYFLKGRSSLTPLNESLRRLTINPGEKILIADDSPAYRGLLRKLLVAHRFQVVEAEDGVVALEQLKEHPDTMLVIADYEMPNMDGIELVRQIRSHYSPDDLAILGASTLGSGALSAAFLKSGADDFLTKPFLHEEFYCRVYRSIRTLEQMSAIKRAAYRDHLTGLPNRLSFFRTVPRRYEQAKQDGRSMMTAMADIDFFKRINDTYGHAGGDEALVRLAKIIEAWLPAGMVASRFGGEEFCIVGTSITRRAARELLEELRARVAGAPIVFQEQTIRFTLSIGATMVFDEDLDAMINRADTFLYAAKEAGRNRVMIENED